ncbi:hypothetical protein ACQP2P_39305 [Dactylosporangium sp. CA-139114]|uniref:hypothetical protein n=1 Tax=Dactylosporangium sp. CA-139114 TaxID=3239931 RepID=UPI003D964CF2
MDETTHPHATNHPHDPTRRMLTGLVIGLATALVGVLFASGAPAFGHGAGGAGHAAVVRCTR